jgi:hypothetical protein
VCEGSSMINRISETDDYKEPVTLLSSDASRYVTSADC